MQFLDFTYREDPELSVCWLVVAGSRDETGHTDTMGKNNDNYCQVLECSALSYTARLLAADYPVVFTHSPPVYFKGETGEVLRCIFLLSGNNLDGRSLNGLGPWELGIPETVDSVP